MKILFASDLHGSLYYSRLLLKQFEVEKADQLVLLGDYLYHGPRNPLTKDYNPMEVAHLLNSIKDKIIGVRGNCDSEVDQMVLEFDIKSDYKKMVIDHYNFFLTHGHLFQASEIEVNQTTIFVSGHTHVPLLKREGIYILNPGSISLPKEEYPSSYAVYDNGRIQIKTFDNIVLKELELS